MPRIIVTLLAIFFVEVMPAHAIANSDTLVLTPHRQWLSIKTDSVTSSEVRRLLGSIIASYEAEGYLQVSASVVSGEHSGTSPMIEIEVVPGPLLRLERIQIESENNRLQSYGRRLLGARATIPLTASVRRQLQGRSERSLTWRPDGDIVYRIGSGADNVEAQIRYRALPLFGFRLRGGIGFGSQTALSGDGELTSRRLFAIDDQLQLNIRRAENERSFSTEYASMVSLFDLEKVAGWVSSRDRVDRFSEFEGGLGVESFQGGLSGFGVDLKFARVTARSSAGSLTRSSFGLFGSSEFRSREKRLRTKLNWRVDYLSRSTNDSSATASSFENVQGLLALRTRTLLTGSLELAVHLRADIKKTTINALPESELLLIGGQESLRGYRDQQFLAENAVIVQLEPTVRQGKSDLFIFGDFGYLELPRFAVSPENSSSDKRFEFGYGLGARLTDDRRTLTIGLGWSSDGSLGEPRLFVELAESL